MSTDAYLRNSARESRIWKPFLYSFPFSAAQSADRSIIFGLYASSHLNKNKYLLEIETEDLANLLSNYNARIADLTADEQKVLAEIVSRRYLASIDQIIHDSKMATKQAGIEADEDIWDAKIAALSADEAALETMAAKVTSETQKTSARITEIQSYIEIEGINLSQVDIDIAEKEIQSSRVDIQKLDVANQILKIQMDTVGAAQEIVDIDLRIARSKVDVAEVNRTINKINLLDSELSIEQAQTAVAVAEIPVAEARVVLAEAKTDEVQAEIDHQTTLLSQEATKYAKKIDLMDTRHTGSLEKLAMQEEEQSLSHDLKKDASELDITFASADSTLQQNIDATRVSVMSRKASNEWSKSQAAIRVAETMAAANIATTLTHTVAKAVE